MSVGDGTGPGTHVEVSASLMSPGQEPNTHESEDPRASSQPACGPCWSPEATGATRCTVGHLPSGAAGRTEEETPHRSQVRRFRRRLGTEPGGATGYSWGATGFE